jgi:hypothetical protein
MYVCMHVCVYVCVCVCMYVSVYVCMYVCTYVCMYVYELSEVFLILNLPAHHGLYVRIAHLYIYYTYEHTFVPLSLLSPSTIGVCMHAR